MRLSLLLCTVAFPFALQAETIEAQSRIVSVTVYPWGANVVRRVEFDAPAGVHDLVVPDMPMNIPVESLRVAGGDGLKVGGVNLATGRLPAPEAEPSAEVKAAEAEVERLEDLIRRHDESIAAIRLRVDAANEQWNFLRNLGDTKASEAVSAGDPEALRSLTKIVGEETLAARQAAHNAEIEARAAERAKKEDIEALEEARRALSALITPPKDRAVLTLAVEAAGDGPASVDVTTFTNQASWRPVYDMRLTREGEPSLDLERSVLVSQRSGEDWQEVELTLSTARPSERNAPSHISPWLRRIYEGEVVAYGTLEEKAEMRSAPSMAMIDEVVEAAPVVEAAAVVMQGATVTYNYGNLVNVRNGVEDLRLKLDTVTMTPELKAVAVPSYDQTAFMVADLTNETGEIILPGTAQLYVDGAMVGSTGLPLIANGVDAKVGFGPIDGIRLTRTVPNRSEGERGILVSSNELDEVAILKIENLSGEAWPIQVLDRVPYSEQDDLEIDYRATPAPSEVDVDGKRGVLAWNFDLGAGDTKEIRLEHNIEWPEGYSLQ